MFFLDPEKPIATCAAETCDGCEVSQTIQCHFRPLDLIHFVTLAFSSFLLGGYGIYQVGAWWLLPWLLFIFGFFGLAEIRAICSHCPHYAEEGGSLKCWANYGSPKVWKFRPGPLTASDKIILFGGFAVVWGYPLFFLVMAAQWFILVVYLLAAAGFALTLKLAFCTRCMNLACPLNAVPEEVGQKFLDKNPQLAEALRKEKRSA